MNPLHIVAEALGVVPDDGFTCCVCGESPFGPGVKLGANFADYDLLSDPSSRETCAGCSRIMSGRPGDDPPPLRTVSFVVSDGAIEILDRTAMFSLLTRRSDDLDGAVISWSQSRQKHHALRAGISDARAYSIGADAGVIDYVPRRDAVLIESVSDLIGKRGGKQSFTRAAVATGSYSSASVSSFGAANHARREAVISVYRRGRRSLLDLILWCCPSEDHEEKEIDNVIDPTDELASRLLGAIARGSSVRAEDGLTFWGSYFQRRCVRFARKPLRDFVASMMTECDVAPSSEAASAVTDMMASMDEAQERSVMESIRDRTSLVLALSYDHRKGDTTCAF